MKETKKTCSECGKKAFRNFSGDPEVFKCAPCGRSRGGKKAARVVAIPKVSTYVARASVPSTPRYSESAHFDELEDLEEIHGDAVKHDTEKPRLDLLSSDALVGIAMVLSYGAKKYSAHNWRKGFDWSRNVGAAMRHISAFNGGEDIDPESGLPHVDMALCELMFLSEFQKTNTGNDDRYKRS